MNQKNNNQKLILDQLLYEKANKIGGGLYHKTLIRFFDIRHSNIERVNLAKCFNYLFDTIDQPLNETIIKTYHKLLKTGSAHEKVEWFNIGDYKAKENRVDWYGTNVITVLPENVAQEMTNLLNWFNSLTKVTLDDILDLNMFFLLIHPFQDGNGRLIRLIMLRECLRNNITPFIVRDELHHQYCYGINEYRQCNKKPLKDICKMFQKEYLELIKDCGLGSIFNN